MEARFSELTRRFDGSKLLGYLNFSDGRPDARVRRQFADLFGSLAESDDPKPWLTINDWLLHRAEELSAGESSAFKDLDQARDVIPAVFEEFPRLYREFHKDLLAHQPDQALFTAFVMARVAEAVLKVRSSGSPAERLAASAIPLVNDYVGYRPTPVLENGQLGEIDQHEKVAPIPLYLAGAGISPGRYAEIVAPALALLKETDQRLLEEAMLEPDAIEELALDPRAVDHVHPINKRPNFLFGEWDPHRIDGKGNYRRFVVRQLTLDALAQWVVPGPPNAERDPGSLAERRFEAAAVLAGTVLMGAGICGSGPTAYDSEVTLSKLVPRIARYRDDFYKSLLAVLPGSHGERLRREAERLKQPFAGVRQFLNQTIAAERALHLQERRLALLFASMGYPTASRARAARIPAPSVRLLAEIRLRHAEIGRLIRDDRLADATKLLAEVEDFFKRGIGCGAFIDPWCVLGFQGLYPIFAGREDTVRDPRAEDFILTVGKQFDLYAQALAAATTSDAPTLRTRLDQSMGALADWWDQYATATITDLPHVVGHERAEAAAHVANALSLWKQGGATDPSFWRKHRDGFKSPAAYAQVIDALLAYGDYRAAMALLITWLSEADSIPLQDPSASFMQLAFRWLRGVTATGTVPLLEKAPLVRRFFELLEVNADDRWDVPEILDQPAKESKSSSHNRDRDDDDRDDDDTFASAYEGMTFQDSTDDGNEGSIVDDGPKQRRFALDADAEKTEERLRFLAAVAGLWRAAARPDLWPRNDSASAAAIKNWLDRAQSNLDHLHRLLEAIDDIEVPAPIGGVEAVMEYDRRRVTKGNLLEIGVTTVVETAAAARALAALLARATELPPVSEPSTRSMDTPLRRPFDDDDPGSSEPAWESLAAQLEKAILSASVSETRRLLPTFIALFRHQPLLVYPPSDGGPPGPAASTQTALQVLQSLLARLPKLGLLRETFQLLKLAWSMERNDPPSGRRVSSFDQLFRTALVGTVEAVLAASGRERNSASPARTEDGDPIAAPLRTIAEAYHGLWLQHSQSIRLSVLEAVLDADEWERLKTFIRTYGGDLFTGRFLTLSNVRGILREGVVEWMNRLTDPDTEPGANVFGSAEHPTDRPKLADHWETEEVNRTDATRHLELVLQAIVEHYDEYRDYNTTTTQSDYGENLYILLDYLRLKVAYNRYAWRLTPWTLAHDVLCRRGFDDLVEQWRDFIASRTKRLSADLLKELNAREAEHAIRLRTIRDRLEEQFLQPLQIDRAAARVVHAAAAIRDGQPEMNPDFAALQAAVAPLAASPSGVGLDVPLWLRRLEEELRRVQGHLIEHEDDETEPDAAEPPDLDPMPQVPPLTLEELKRQLNDWEEPIGEG